MNQKNMVHQLDVNQLLLQWINIKEEVLKNIEDKEKQDECQKPDSKYKSSFEWCQFFDIK